VFSVPFFLRDGGRCKLTELLEDSAVSKDVDLPLRLVKTVAVLTCLGKTIASLYYWLYYRRHSSTTVYVKAALIS